MVDGGCHVEEEPLVAIFLDETQSAVGDPFLIVDVELIIPELLEVGMVEAVNIIEAQSAHILTDNAVVVLHSPVDRGIGSWIGCLAVGDEPF